MASRTKPAQQAAPVDPLADLREPDAPGLPGVPPVPENDPPEAMAETIETEDLQTRLMVTAEVQEEMVAEVVAAWHQDPTAQGFLHGGGSMCGCRYIARLAIRAAVPVTPEVLTEEEPEEPGE